MINDIKISEHFKLSEFQSGDSQEVKIDSELVAKLEKLRERIGQPIRINSGYRTPEHNKAVGGSYNSQHMKGVAVDIDLPQGLTIDELANMAEAIGFDGIGKYYTFVHLDVRGYHAHWDERK